MIRVIAADDEPDALAGMAHLLQQQPDINLVAQCSNGLETIEQVLHHKPDLLLLDIQMPGANGFEVLNSLPTPWPAIVFVTAYDAYALRAFEVHAVDYLLKPYTDARFYEALQQARLLLAAKHGANQAAQQAALQQMAAQAAPATNRQQPAAFNNNQLIVKANGCVLFVPFAQVVWLQAYDYYIKVHTLINGRQAMHLVRNTLKHMEAHLPNPPFVRVHRSAIVNMQHVQQIDAEEGSSEKLLTLHLATAAEVKVSRNYKKALAPYL